MRVAVAIGAVLSCLALPAVGVSDPIDPAQAIAQKFSEADKPAPRPNRKAKPPAAAKAAEPATPAPDVDYELDMLQRAHAEEADRQKAAAAAARATVPVTMPKPTLALQPEPAPEPAPEPQMIAIPEPITEPLPSQPAEPQLYATNPISRSPAARPQLRQLADAEPAPASIPAPSGPRATVLLVLELDTRERLFKPDPIICFDQQCWISDGLDSPAKLMPRSAAVALKSTETTTGDSCSGKTGCAFRNVAVPSNSQIEIVEVGESRGTANGAYTVVPDTTCRKLEGELTCSNALVTHAYRVWVVPETTAKTVGASSLEEAVAEGLQSSDDDDNTGK